MDQLHTMLSELHAENKSAQQPPRSHLTIFREFLAELDRLQTRPPRIAREKLRTRKRPRRARG
jgi:hypothetical protein